MADATSGKVPVSECVRASWMFLADNWKQLLPAALIVAALATLGPVAALALTAQSVGGLYLGAIVTIIADVLFTAVVLRKAVRGEFRAPTGLAFGQDELNLIAVVLCMLLLFLPFGFLMVLILTFMLVGRMAGSGESVETLADDPEALNQVMVQTMLSPPGIVLGAACLVAFVVIAARLCMINAATIGERKVVFLQTWSWSRGNVARVIAALLLTALPVVVLNVIVTALLGQTGSGTVTLALLVGYLVTLAGLIASIPLIALGAQLYKGLRPPGFVAK